MLKEEKRVTVSLGKREILLFSIALLITYGLVFAFGVEFGKSWMRSLLESQEIASTATPAVPEVQPPAVDRGAAPAGEAARPAPPVIEVRPSAEKPASPAPKVAEGGEPTVETPKPVPPAVSTEVEKAKKAANAEVEKAVAAAVAGSKKAEETATSSAVQAQHKVSAKAEAAAEKVGKATAQIQKHEAPKLQKTTVKPHLVGGGYLVQVGAFSKESSANALVKRLTSKGYHASTTKVKRGSKTFYKVFVGPYGNEKAARHAMDLLKKREKLTGYLVAPKKR